jgi:hypothetical protein
MLKLHGFFDGAHRIHPETGRFQSAGTGRGMVTNGKSRTSLMVRVAPRLEQLRTAGLRKGLRIIGGTLLRQVMGRFPRFPSWIGPSVGQRQAIVGKGRGSLTDVELPSPSRRGASPESTRALIETLSSEPDWNRRARAALALFAASDESALEALFAALSDPAAEVATASISALAHRSGARVTAELARVLRSADDFYNPMTRAAAMRALAQRDEDIDVALWASVVGAIDAELSMAAIAIIADARPKHALALILPVLEAGSSGYYLPMVRVAAARALASAGVLTADVCNRLLRSERDEIVRGMLGPIAAAEPARAAS